LTSDFSDFLGPPVSASFAACIACVDGSLDENAVELFGLCWLRSRVCDDLVQCVEEVVGFEMVEFGVDVGGVGFRFFGADCPAWVSGESLIAIAKKAVGV